MKSPFTNTILVICLAYLVNACNTATPEKYFDVAVLNVNMIDGFSDDALLRELRSPSATLLEGTKDQTRSRKRTEVIVDKVSYVGENLESIKNLTETADTKEMIQASLSLHEFVLPVYKTEFTQLAKLYDNSAPASEIDALIKTIMDKYSAGYVERLNKVISTGKKYASEHNIKVNWH